MRQVEQRFDPKAPEGASFLSEPPDLICAVKTVLLILSLCRVLT